MDRVFDYEKLKDPQYFRDGRLDAHSDHRYYASLSDMENDIEEFKESLNGLWKFHYARNYKSAVRGFEETDYCCRDWEDIHVPAHIQMEGYDVPQYANVQYPWEGYDEIKPGEIPEYFNPVASYVKYFTVPERMKGRRLFISFQGAESSLALWLNGRFVGYSEDSFTPSEFELTDYLTEGEIIDAVQDDRLGDDLARVLEEQLQNGVLRLGQVDGEVTGGDGVGGLVQADGPGLQGDRQPGGGIFPQVDGDAGQQLPAVEGFFQVVHRPFEKQAYSVLHPHLGADHHHRNPLDLRQHLLPGQAGQHQVQQYQVRPLPLQQQYRLRPRVGPQDGVALPLEQLLQNIADVDIVINDRDGFHSRPPLWFSPLYSRFMPETRGRLFLVEEGFLWYNIPST